MAHSNYGYYSSIITPVKNDVFWDLAPCRSCVNRRSSEHRFTKDPHGATPQKTAFFIVTAVKTSNLITSRLFVSIFSDTALNPSRLFQWQCSPVVGLFISICLECRGPENSIVTLFSPSRTHEMSNIYFPFIHSSSH
jgi:hypothetical protein